MNAWRLARGCWALSLRGSGEAEGRGPRAELPPEESQRSRHRPGPEGCRGRGVWHFPPSLTRLSARLCGDEAVGGPLQVHRRDDPRRAVLPGARQHTPRLAAARGPPCHVPQTEDAGSSVLSFGRTGCGPRPAGRGGTSARTLLATVQCPDFDRLVRLRTAHRSIKRVTSLTDGRARPW